MFTLDSKGDITDMLKNGENEVKIALRSSMRNLFGPHHFKPMPEPMGVGPQDFNFRGGWYGDKIPEDYTEQYNSVPFGATNIFCFGKKN